MWWDAAQTIGSHVRWYFVDDAPFAPFPHVFSSENWDMVHWFDDGAGEADDQTQPYDKGAPPTPFAPVVQPGDVPCGPPDWWLNGAPSDAPPEVWLNGIPECCHAKYVAVGCSCGAVYVQEQPGPTLCGSCYFQPTEWLLTITDVANDVCTGCAGLNGTNIILYNVPSGDLNPGGEISNGCYWDSVLLPAPCSSGPFAGLQAYWELKFDTGGTFLWYLRLRMGLTMNGVFQPITTTAWNCVRPNVAMTPTWDGLTCISHMSVTLTPG